VSDLEDGTIVMLPSATFPIAELRKIVGINHYEERLLCMVLLLRRPELHMVYVTSLPVDEAVVEYYLGFLPDPVGAGERLTMITLNDPGPEALSAKLVGRDDVLDAIRSAAGDPDRAYVLPFNVTPYERTISERLGIPLYGPSPELAVLGSKTGSRRVAMRAGVETLDGAESLNSLTEVERAVADLVRGRGVGAVVVKLNNGFSGQGNALLDVSQLRLPLTETPTTFCASEESWASFTSKIAAEGAIVEELLQDTDIVSPSVQLRIAPSGAFEVVSTHDQVLGGPSNHVYLGCRFPADPGYRLAIQERAERVAAVLASDGVIGSFGIDFLVLPDGRVYLSEINLRMGGTTHPYWMAKLATGGDYVHDRGELVVDGEARSYEASDNLKSLALVGRAPADVIELLHRQGWAFDPATNAGVMVHLLGALRDHGKMGITCVAPSVEEASALFDEVSAHLTSGA
jgi:hypothetical protein